MASHRDRKRRESLPSALVQIAVAAVGLGLGLYAFHRHTEAKRRHGEGMRIARATALEGNQSDLKEAATTLEHLFELDPDAPDAVALGAAVWTDLWLDHHQPGAQAKAEALLARALRPGAPPSGEVAGVAAQHRLARGDVDGALGLAEEARRRGGPAPRLLLAEGLALERKGERLKARASLVDAMDKGFRDGRYACAVGEALLEDGAPTAADTFRRARAEHPQLVRARLGQALARLLAGDGLPQLTTELDALLQSDALSEPERARATAVSAGLLEAEGRYAEAIARAEAALKIEPTERWAMLFRARALAATADPHATEAFLALVDASPMTPFFYADGAARLSRVGQTDGAKALAARYQGLITPHPTAP